jgi:hypothetical protein
MRLSSAQATTAALCLATIAQATTNHTRLQHWPKDAAAALEKMIVANANSSNYACFDMDVRHLSQKLTQPTLAQHSSQHNPSL